MPITRAYAQAAEPGNFFVAGKNKIINGDFNINQRAFTSITCGNAEQYGFDRWLATSNTGTVTMTPQNFTAGTAPVAGYEGRSFVRLSTSGQSAANAYTFLIQKIEDVRTFANQTITISFWAKANSGTPGIAIELAQNFGSGGSPSSTANSAVGKVTISTSWARYSATFAVPSIAGKTIGTTANTSFLGLNLWLSAGTDFNVRASSLGVQNADIDIWGVQVEAGSVATPFTTATGTLAGELAACQRYYWRMTSTVSGTPIGFGSATGAADNWIQVPNPVPMRVRPTSADYSNLTVSDGYSYTNAVNGVTIYDAGTNVSVVSFATSGQTARYPAHVRTGTSGGHFGLNAEL